MVLHINIFREKSENIDEITEPLIVKVTLHSQYRQIKKVQ